jgi:hypothetical protein
LAAGHLPGHDLRMTNVERRRERSTRTDEALGLLLDHARDRLGVRALALSTAKGAVIAGTGEGVYRLAELGASIDAGGAARAGVATWRLRVDDWDLLLTSAGPAMDPDLGAGVRRILARH